MRNRWGFWHAYGILGAVAMFAVWGHRFPAGIDLPQHANLFQIWASLNDPKTGYSFFYEILPFTPYLLTYLVALPLTKIGGALFATKVLLSVAVLATPWQMHRWLTVTRGEPWWALWGYVLALGFGYLWGFLSWMLSFPIAFAYFVAVEDQRENPTPRNIGIAAAIGSALFFCHALTFAITMFLGGVFALLAGRPRKIAVQLLHLAPAALLTVAWALAEKRPGIPHPKGWPPEVGRIALLFGGEFTAHADYFWGIVGLAVVAINFGLARPLFSWSPRRWLPVALAAVAFACLPDTIKDVWLIGTRFATYVHAFAPLALQPTVEGGALRRLRLVNAALVLAALVAFNVRLGGFNAEMKGLDQIAAAVEPQSDVQGLVPWTGGDSAALGPWQLNQAMAWLTTLRGGFLENDSGRYFTIPVQRRIDVSWPTHYRYYLTHGDRGAGQSMATSTAGMPVQLVKEVNRWQLFEAQRPPQRTGDVTVVRYGQGWADLQIDRSVTGGVLTVAGQSYPSGIGTHSLGATHVRLARPGQAFTGKVGIDDAPHGQARAELRVFGPGRRLLWSSGPVAAGQPAVSFSASLPGGVTDLLLLATPIGDIRDSHIDWVDLRVSP